MTDRRASPTTSMGTAATRPLAHAPDRRSGARAIQPLTEEHLTLGSPIAAAALFFLGAIYMLPQLETFRLSVISPSFLFSLLLGALGWSRRTNSPLFGLYFLAAGAFSFMSILSAVALWDRTAMYWTVTAATWPLFIIPGLAWLFWASESYRRAFVMGLAVGVLVYGAARVWQLSTGSQAPIATNELGAVQSFLHLNRNQIDSLMLFATPLMFSFRGSRMRFLRWPIVAAGLAWLFLSGGRAVFFGLPLLGLGYLLLQPNFGRRLHAVVGVLMVAVVCIVGIRFVGADATIGAGRAVAYLKGERDDADVLRQVLITRAMHLGAEHPVFGVGYGKEYGAEDAALGRIKDKAAREQAQNAGVHNVFLWLFASLGPPAAAAFVAMLAIVLTGGIRRRADHQVRWVTLALVGAIAGMMFYSELDLSYFSLALALGVVARSFARAGERSAFAPVESIAIGTD